MSVWFESRLNPWYISIPSNPNLYSTKIIMKKRWQTITSSVSICTISPTATPLPNAYGCVAVYIAGRRTNLVFGGRSRQPKIVSHRCAAVHLPINTRLYCFRDWTHWFRKEPQINDIYFYIHVYSKLMHAQETPLKRLSQEIYHWQYDLPEMIIDKNNLPFYVTRRQYSSMYLTWIPAVCCSNLHLVVQSVPHP